MTSLADAAVLLAERGHRVLPVGPDKAPRIAGGFHAASDILERIWGWEQEGLFEGGGIGLAIPDRWFVVDVDPRNGGAETLVEVCAAAGASLPPTRTVRSGGGGWHFYFALPDDRDIRGSLGPGVDIKKPGRAYVLVPPSPGYRYVRGGRPAPAPEWLLDELTVTTRAEGTASERKFFPFMAGTGYGLAALRNTVERVRSLEEGGRRAAINKEAFCLAQLVAGGELDETAALEALFQATLDTGLTQEQALAPLKSGWTAGLEKPWSAE